MLLDFQKHNHTSFKVIINNQNISPKELFVNTLVFATIKSLWSSMWTARGSVQQQILSEPSPPKQSKRKVEFYPT